MSINFIKRNKELYSQKAKLERDKYPLRKEQLYQQRQSPPRPKPSQVVTEQRLRRMEDHFNEEMGLMRREINRLRDLVNSGSPQREVPEQSEEDYQSQEQTYTREPRAESVSRTPSRTRQKSSYEEEEYREDPNPNIKGSSSSFSVPIIQALIKSVKLSFQVLGQFVYQGYMRRTNKDVVAKFGRASESALRSIKQEYQFYQVVWRNVVSISSTGFPKVYEFVEDLEFHVIVLERLGDSLLHVWRKLDFNFSTATIAQVGIDLIGVLQFIHELGYLVRNLCPGHVLVQPNGGLALIDFTQVAKTMLNKRPLQIKSSKESLYNKFSSSAFLKQMPESRRDDLESLGYLLVFLFKRRLPWTNADGKQGIVRARKVVTLKSLCQGCPMELQKYFDLVLGWKNATPPYNELKELLQGLTGMPSGKRVLFDWNRR